MKGIKDLGEVGFGVGFDGCLKTDIMTKWEMIQKTHQVKAPEPDVFFQSSL